jgi:hypothetical protein
MYDYFHFSNEWLTETCLGCGSVNHIFISQNAHAWECWNCMECWFIDTMAIDALVIECGLEHEDEVWHMLINYHPAVIYLHGQVVRDG